MRRKNLMTALMCTFCLAVSAVAPMAVMAEETELVTEEAAEDDAADAEEDTDAEDGAEDADSTEETEALPQRPDYNALDYVTLGEYTGLYVVLEPSEVTDMDIKRQIHEAAGLSDELETVTEGTVEDCDTANIDYVGTLNGEPFDGGTDKGVDLVIGSGYFIDGFEEGLIGAAIGETVELPLTFPENYGNTELAGQDVVFTVTVNEVKRLPDPLTDELINTITQGEYTDVASYQNSIRESLESQADENKEAEIQQEIIVQLGNSCEIKEYPQEMIDYLVANTEAQYRQNAEWYSMEFEEYLSAAYGVTYDEFVEQITQSAELNLKLEMILKAIAEQEGMEVSEEEYTAGCEEYAQRYGFETVEDFLAANEESNVRINVLFDKVLDFLTENAVVEEVQETESETGLEDGEASTETDSEAAEKETEAPENGETQAEETVTEADTEA